LGKLLQAVSEHNFVCILCADHLAANMTTVWRAGSKAGCCKEIFSNALSVNYALFPPVPAI